jgi:hypothetical protein
MSKIAVFISIVLLIFANGCSNPEEVKKLSSEIEKINSQITEAQKERDKYGEGSALHSMVSLRLTVLEQTRSMLEQKKVAAWYFPRFSYTVDSKSYTAPSNLDEIITKTENEIRKARDEWKISQGKAESAGGLFGAIAAMEAEMKGLRVAQLEYQLSAYRNGYPPLYPQIEPSQLESPVSKVTGNLKKEVRADSSKPIEQKPTKDEIELASMKAAISVKLLNKKYYPSNWEAGRYEDNLNLEFEYKNSSEKEIRAFTGIVTLMDIFDREFLRVNLTVDNKVPAGKTIKDSDKSLKINKFNDGHEKLVSTDMKNLKMKFIPISILFSDGSKLGSATQ